MRVLLINVVCGIRSTGRICTDIAELLEEKGHECKIAYGREEVPEQYKKYAVKIGTELDAKLHALGSRIFDNTGFYSKRATEKFIEWVKEYDPDIINLHNIHGYYINIKLLFDYLRESGKPVVWTLHDCWAFTGHCPHFMNVDCKKWLEEKCANCPKKHDYPASIFLDNSKGNLKIKKTLFASLNNMTIVTPSQWLSEVTKKTFLAKYPIKVINNGINTENFQPIQSDFKKNNNLEGKKVLLGIASVWYESKGLKDFIALREMLDEDYEIVLIGLTEKQIRELPKGIIGITRTNNVKQLAEIYTAADVFVNPTREENYPTVNLEAQACGTPVVTYNTGGSAECLLEGIGAVTKEKTPEALKAALLETLDNKKQIDTQKLKLTFSQKVRFGKYINLFEEIGIGNEK